MTLSSKSFFQKTILLLLSVLCCGVSAWAQQCSTTIAQLADAPELRGFRLGMTPEQVRARVPQIQFGRPDEIGVAKTSINPSFDPRFDQASFVDVRTISFDFLDGKLTTLWIGFEGSFKWKTVDEFVTGISKSLNLPDGWPTKRGGRQLRCDGFSVFVSMIAGGPSVRLTDEAADQTITARREEAAAAADSVVIGDKATKLYYPSDCDELENVPEANRITFKDKDQAEKAGYKRAKACE
jgi:hypothetical protein